MHKSLRFVHFYVELIAGFEPATSSLPRSRAEIRRRKNKPIYLCKVFAINHNIQYEKTVAGKNAEQQQTPPKRRFVCYRLLFFRFRAFKTVKNRLFIGKNGAKLPRFFACFETIANTFSTDYSREFTRVEQIFFETV